MTTYYRSIIISSLKGTQSRHTYCVRSIYINALLEKLKDFVQLTGPCGPQEARSWIRLEFKKEDITRFDSLKQE
jgi:hypothetical protein